MKFTKTLLLTLSLLIAQTSFADDYSGGIYTGNQSQSMQNIIEGKIEDMREVTVDATSTMGQTAGIGVGGALGGLLGNSVVKDGNGRTAATILLGAVGAIAGNYTAQTLSKERAFEYVVRLNDGRAVAITQSFDDRNIINTGDRVRIIQGGRTRVVKMI